MLYVYIKSFVIFIIKIVLLRRFKLYLYVLLSVQSDISVLINFTTSTMWHFVDLKFIKIYSPHFHCCIFPINNSTFTSQYPLTSHTTFAISNYNFRNRPVTHFQLTIPHLHLSIR